MEKDPNISVTAEIIYNKLMRKFVIQDPDLMEEFFHDIKKIIETNIRLKLEAISKKG
jgi:hypothetical protein